jgi:hypothetical protein
MKTGRILHALGLFGESIMSCHLFDCINNHSNQQLGKCKNHRKHQNQNALYEKLMVATETNYTSMETEKRTLLQDVKFVGYHPSKS